MKIFKFYTACVLGVLCISPVSFAKLQTYTVQDDACEYENQFDDQKHSLKQIKDTLELEHMAYGIKLNVRALVSEPKDIPSIREQQLLNQQYAKIKQKIQSLTPVNLHNYQKLKTVVQRQLDDEHKMNALLLQAYDDPKVLLTRSYGQQCYAIAKKMNVSGQALKIGSREVLAEGMRAQLKLGNSQKWVNEQFAELEVNMAKSNGEQYAKLNLLHYWNNCAVDAWTNDEPFLSKLNVNKDLFVKSKELYCEH